METLIDTVSCMVVEGEGHSTTFLMMCVLIAVMLSSSVSYAVGALFASAVDRKVVLDPDEDDGVRVGYKDDREDW